MMPDGGKNQHLSNDMLIRLLDDELTGEEAASAESHLIGCTACHNRFSELRRTSHSFDSFISSLHPAFLVGERQQLAQKLDLFEDKVQKSEGRWSGWFLGWGFSIAAALTLAVLSFPRWEMRRSAPPQLGTLQTASSDFEVDGETFAALPYSNSDLPLGAPHIVRMQVPVSSLAEAGIYLEPSGNHISTPDRAVLADVLLGLDGQPLGVHVLTSD